MFCPQRGRDDTDAMPRLATNPKYKNGEGHPNGRISSKSEVSALIISSAMAKCCMFLCLYCMRIDLTNWIEMWNTLL